MQQSDGSGIFGSLAKQFKRMARAMKEKPQVKLDDYVLEHFMLYHGLVGTSEENQRKFRDIRQDVFDALQNKNSAETAIALKLPPLYWQEKLEMIFADAQQEYALPVLKQCLLPPEEVPEQPPEHVPLKHPDWRVRANAARILAFLQLEEAVPHIVRALDDASETDEHKPGFMHIAYALSQVQVPESQSGLAKHLENEDHWFRVDSAGALANWPIDTVRSQLMHAMQQQNLLNDYMSVAITRKQSALNLLDTSDAPSVQGALEVIIGLAQAAQGPFANELGHDPVFVDIMLPVAELAKNQPTPRALRAAFLVGDNVIEIAEDLHFGIDEDKLKWATSAARELRERCADQQFRQQIIEWARTESAHANSPNLRHVLDLISRCEIAEAAQYFTPLLRKDHPAINELMEAAGALGLTETVPAIIKVINDSVDVPDRTSRPLSKQPVFEDDAIASKVYWQALKALGKLPTNESLELLLIATNDFASDKRQQALQSLISVGEVLGNDSQRVRIEACVARGLNDPAGGVRAAALQGVGRLSLIGLLPETIKLVGSKETAVSREAVNALKALSNSGHADKVKPAVNAELAAERDLYKRQRLESFIKSAE